MRDGWIALIVLTAVILVAACAGPPAGSGAAPAARSGEPAAASGSGPTSGTPAAPPSASGATASATSQAPGSASGSVPAPRPLDPPQTVRIANVGLAAQGPTYLAIEHGYFAELGLIPEVVFMNSTTEIVALLSNDQLDVGFGAISPAFFNAAARGVDVRMVADHGSNLPGRSTVSLAVRNDLLERKPWSGYGDLRGMKIAVQQIGTQTEYYLEKMLQRGGLQREDVELIALPFPDMALAFANKAIDAGIFNEPWATQQEQQGIITKVTYADDVDPGGHVAGVLFSEKFARNTAAARNYSLALLRGVRDYWDAYDGRGDFQPVVDALRKYTAASRRGADPQDPAHRAEPARLPGPSQASLLPGLVRRAGPGQPQDRHRQGARPELPRLRQRRARPLPAC
jgi:ABC-type nitrate/sulfonate/bicarbonate transport system substrate-binding protein